MSAALTDLLTLIPIAHEHGWIWNATSDGTDALYQARRQHPSYGTISILVTWHYTDDAWVVDLVHDKYLADITWEDDETIHHIGPATHYKLVKFLEATDTDLDHLIAEITAKGVTE